MIHTGWGKSKELRGGFEIDGAFQGTY